MALGEGFEPSTDTAFYGRRLYPWATLEVRGTSFAIRGRE